eukprot:437210-Heterocapsa_arctica.AAC.1
MVVEIEEGLKQYRANFRSHRMRRKDWMRDEYDEIWGFDEVPYDQPNDQIHADALQDRKEREVPTQIEDLDLADFYSRMERRRESRQRRGINWQGGTLIADT